MKTTMKTLALATILALGFSMLGTTTAFALTKGKEPVYTVPVFKSPAPCYVIKPPVVPPIKYQPPVVKPPVKVLPPVVKPPVKVLPIQPPGFKSPSPIIVIPKPVPVKRVR